MSVNVIINSCTYAIRAGCYTRTSTQLVLIWALGRPSLAPGSLHSQREDLRGIFNPFILSFTKYESFLCASPGLGTKIRQQTRQTKSVHSLTHGEEGDNKGSNIYGRLQGLPFRRKGQKGGAGRVEGSYKENGLPCFSSGVSIQLWPSGSFNGIFVNVGR